MASVAICCAVELTSCHMAILHGNPRKLHVEIIVGHFKQKDEPGSTLQYSITCDAGVNGIGELPHSVVPTLSRGICCKGI